MPEELQSTLYANGNPEHLSSVPYAEREERLASRPLLIMPIEEAGGFVKIGNKRNRRKSKKKRKKKLSLNKAIKKSLTRVVLVPSDHRLNGKPEILFESLLKKKSKKKRKKKKKKGKKSKLLSPWGKSLKKMAKRQDKASRVYLKRHKRSDKKKKNGWFKDFAKNYGKALSKAL